MAISNIQTNNKLVKFRQEIIREYVRENLFSPYMGEDMTSIIRVMSDLKSGGEQINIPLVTRLSGTATGTGNLTGSEEKIDNYGMRVWIDWARHAIAMNDAEKQKDSADIWSVAKPLLSDWGKELQRNEIIEALLALPTESAPASLGSASGQRVNGILYAAANAAQRNTWNSDNSDRVLYGATTANYNATHATALATVDTTNDLFNASAVQLLKLIAKKANPRIRPYKLKDGREYFVTFAGSLPFRDLKQSLATVNKDARPREDGGLSNPLFQDGDLIYDGVIIREVPEIDDYVANVWTSLLTAGTSSARVNPVFLCGQSAMAMPWGRMPTPTQRSDTDYEFVDGVGVKMAYGVSKIFKKQPFDGTALKQWGVVTGFFANTTT